jgi:arginyl-tRNA--protein-N-Asp/Glu arginylyltransferase
MDENNIDNRLGALVPEIKEYVQGLMLEKGNEVMPADIQAEMMYDLYTRFNDYLMVNLAKSMDEEGFYEFDRMVAEQEPPQKIAQFVREKTDLKQVVNETCDEFRKIYLNKE